MRHLLAHQAGIPAFPEEAVRVDYDDREALVALLAAAAPVHAPGDGVAEHALTYGHLLDEVLRRATGEPLVERFARIAAAAGWDLHLRVEAQDLPRVATLVEPSGRWASDYLADPRWGPALGRPRGAARPGGAELRPLPGHTVPGGGAPRQRPVPGGLLRRPAPARGPRRRAPGPRPVARLRLARGERSRPGARPAGHLDPRLPGRRRGRPGHARDGWRRRLLGLVRTGRRVRGRLPDQGPGRSRPRRAGVGVPSRPASRRAPPRPAGRRLGRLARARCRDGGCSSPGHLPVLHNRGVATPSASYGAAVSAREAEVLAAVSDHLTNAEIAERLFISVRTVESHVSSLLRKLQLADRRELAAAAPAVLDSAATPSPPRPAADGVPDPAHLVRRPGARGGGTRAGARRAPAGHGGRPGRHRQDPARAAGGRTTCSTGSPAGPSSSTS